MPPIPKVLLLIESSRAAGRALLRGIANYSHLYGPWSFYWEPRGLERARPLLHNLNLDGVIARDIVPMKAVLKAGVPTVVVGHRHRETAGAANVNTDSETVARLAAEHLLSCGFSHFAYCGYNRTSWSERRNQAFARRIAEAGFQVHSRSVPFQQGRSNWRSIPKTLTLWLRRLPKPLGLMACNDDLGRELLEACKLAGLSVPDDVAVIGADNDEVVCGLSDPPLSSVAINFERAGYEAAQALAAMMDAGRKSPPVVAQTSGARSVPMKSGLSRRPVVGGARHSPDTPPRIVAVATHVAPRRSTDILAVEDPCLAKALQFIRKRARVGTSVEAAARSAGISRRALEKRFRKLLNRSALQEIRRVRTDQIARMLLETDLSVSDIAQALGFEDMQHIARYFRAGKGLSPLAYRKKLGRR